MTTSPPADPATLPSAASPASASDVAAGVEPLDAPPPPALPTAIAAPPPRRGSLLRKFLLLLILLALLAADVRMQLRAPLALEAPTTAELSLGERFDHWLGGLAERELFASARQRWYLSGYARFTDKVSALKAGEYRLEVGVTPLGLIDLLQSGKVVLHELRLTEGWHFAQAWKTIQDDPNVQHTLLAASPAELMRALGKPDVDAEGQLFPDTYRFPRNTSDVALLRQANAALEKILASEWATRAPNLPYDSPQQALVMASIVEKETAAPAERPLIAGVFVRRLQLGMRLQTDPAVIYGVGEAYGGSLHTRDLQTDTPYNTYTRTGLPPTPICLPGREAIHAALHPDDGHALYFVSRGDGSHQFSDTLEQHNAAVRRFVPGAR
ncbi:MAG: endolytic transglycosylase MltG [Nevskia sp.]|nr:endolytic transglycosylase MltG [Nevskia sp.]